MLHALEWIDAHDVAEWGAHGAEWMGAREAVAELAAHGIVAHVDGDAIVSIDGDHVADVDGVGDVYARDVLDYVDGGAS